MATPEPEFLLSPSVAIDILVGLSMMTMMTIMMMTMTMMMMRIATPEPEFLLSPSVSPTEPLLGSPLPPPPPYMPIIVCNRHSCLSSDF